MAGERLKEALELYRKRYHVASRQERSRLLDEFCELSGYHRKYATSLLNRPEGWEQRPRQRRGDTYSKEALRVVEEVWKAAGRPWSVRLKALLPLWLPWARGRLRGLTDQVEAEALKISPRQIDRRLKDKKRRLKRRLYGRTKPGTLLRHQVAVRAEGWDVSEPGYTEVDLVAHCGPSARGEFGYSLNLTDIYSGWCESRAVLGRGERAVVAALDQIGRALPFRLRGIDSDNGGEFINHHLVRYCGEAGIEFTRCRPYKKDDNAHIEQKNWTHVRRIWGWERYESPQVIEAMNELYAGDLRLMMNLFQPSVKLKERLRVGARLRRRYEPARTPIDRLADHYAAGPMPGKVRALLELRQGIDPFELSSAIEGALRRIESIRTATTLKGRAVPWGEKRGQGRRGPRCTSPLPPQRGRAALETTHAYR